MVVYQVSEFSEEDFFKTKKTPELVEKYDKVEVELLEKINKIIQEVSEKESILIFPVKPIELCVIVDLSTLHLTN